jgi:hypothetical protein
VLFVGRFDTDALPLTGKRESREQTAGMCEHKNLPEGFRIKTSVDLGDYPSR